MSTPPHPDLSALCADALPPAAVAALALFNAGEYYAQHDAFEVLWRDEPRPVRMLYKAILQVGVGYYQLTRGNQRGAIKMLRRADRWLSELPDRCQGVDLARLRADAAAVRQALERGEPVAEDTLQPVVYTPPVP